MTKGDFKITDLTLLEFLELIDPDFKPQPWQKDAIRAMLSGQQRQRPTRTNKSLAMEKILSEYAKINPSAVIVQYSLGEYRIEKPVKETKEIENDQN